MRITLPSGTAAEIDADVASPRGGLVIAPDIFGLRPLYDDLVARLAHEWQLVVCAVEPFPHVELPPEVERRFPAVPTIDDARHLGDLEQAAAATGQDVVGLIGFCMGGMYCHKAARSDRFNRIVSFYGMIRIPDAWQSPTQGEPLGYLATGHADRVLAIVGELDHYTPDDDIAALRSTGVAVVSYADAEHGFAHDVSRPAHRAADAADAFGRAKAWLSEPGSRGFRAS